MLFRPSHVPSHTIALGARSVGHYRVPYGYRDGGVRKDFIQVFWTVSGSGSIVIKDRTHVLHPGMLALYFPGNIHRIHASEQGSWEYRWWTMDGTLAVPIVNAFGLSPGKIYRASAPPISLFNELTDCIRDITYEGELKAGAVAFQLLSAAAAAVRPHEQKSSTSQPTEDFKTAVLAKINESWQNPGFGVEQLAEALGQPRWGLARRFRAAFGLAPSEYLHRLRIQHALSQLKESNRPIHEIARSCGWEDPNYFARCIRKATRLSPQQFRHV